MTEPDDRKWPALPAEVRDLIEHLFIEDNRRNGKLMIPPDRIDLARTWLDRALTGMAERLGHIEDLCRRYRAVFRWPQPRYLSPEGQRPTPPPSTGFPHQTLLAEEKTRDVASGGPSKLDAAELAEVFLNPFALWDLADLIDATLPDYWLDRFEASGREKMDQDEVEALLAEALTATRERTPGGARQAAVRMRGSATVKGGGSDGWLLSFEGAAEQTLRRKIAEHLYAEAERQFELRLFWEVSGTGLVEFELEVAPAPTRNDLTFMLCFPSGEERELTVEVPHESKENPAATPRERMRSDPSEPVMAQACRFDEKGEVQWGEEMPPRLRLPGVEEA